MLLNSRIGVLGSRESLDWTALLKTWKVFCRVLTCVSISKSTDKKLSIVDHVDLSIIKLSMKQVTDVVLYRLQKLVDTKVVDEKSYRYKLGSILIAKPCRPVVDTKVVEIDWKVLWYMTAGGRFWHSLFLTIL